MKILKWILIVLVSLVVIVLVTALFVDGNIAAEKQITINRPKSEVFAYIKMLGNQNSFSSWAMQDPEMKKEFRGTDGTVGFVSAWDGEKMGKGEQEITKITEGERIDYELRFIKPFESTNLAYMTTQDAQDNQTTVKWGFSGKMNYPMNIMKLFGNMDETIGQDFQIGLENLKTNLESK